MATSPLFFIAGTTGLVDMGYRFFDVNGDWVGARITAGVFEQDALKGTYGVAAATIPPTSRGVHWNSAGTPAVQGDEIFPATGYATDVDALLNHGTGAFAITVTVVDEDSDPVQNATVRVTPGGFTVLTDVNGQGSFSLDAATYTVSISAAGLAFTPETRTVTGNQAGTLVNDLVMTGTAPTPPPDPTLCRLYGYFLLPSGQPAINVMVSATLVSNRPSGASGNIPTYSAVTVQTDDDGYAQLDLIRTDEIDPSPTYTITCQPAKINLQGVTLEAATVDIESLLA